MYKNSARSIFPILLGLALLLLSLTATTHAQSPDFQLATTPSFLCTNPGVDSSTVVSVQSLNGFAGYVALSYKIDPTANNSPTVSSPPSNQDLASGQTAKFTLTILTTTATPSYTYRVTIAGFSPGQFHEAYVELTVSNDCSVGGAVLPATTASPIAEYLGIAIAVGATLAVMALLVYPRNIPKPRP